ncbi:hypothetical protein [Thiothrix lacustris]|uniref:hypothetical protein n=1 Tax=Thiothrix lacustris TaxID=525917 RepID=UPI0027E3B9CE|nr:hypothetical protein [Thiothrix lacustris]WMP16732.1 hypothetical protein RCS87_15300 [Thiothrix lacustris]
MLPIILGAALVGAVVGAFASGSSGSSGNDKVLRELKVQERRNEEHRQQMQIQMQKHKKMLYGSALFSVLSVPVEGIASAIGQKMGFEMWDAFGLSQFFQNMLSAVL